MSARLLNIVSESQDKKKGYLPFDLDTALAETVELGASDLHLKVGNRPLGLHRCHHLAVQGTSTRRPPHDNVHRSAPACRHVSDIGPTA